MWLRFGQSFAFNGARRLARTLVLFLIVEVTTIPSLFAQAALLAIGFVARFPYHSRIVYRPRRTAGEPPAHGRLGTRGAGTDRGPRARFLTCDPPLGGESETKKRCILILQEMSKRHFLV